MNSVRERQLVYMVGGALVVAVGLGVVAVGALRAAQTGRQAEERKASAAGGVRALVVAAVQGPSSRRVSLQGDARPWASVTLYAKVSGYLRSIAVDRGDKVRAGQILAVIESPEINQQYVAASADADYKRTNARRTAALAGPGAVSMREADLDRANAAVAEAVVAGLATQKGYTQLRAPFDGTVTGRFADPGALVQNAMNAQSGALPVVVVSQLHRLRVFVYVDQRDAGLVHIGDPVDVIVAGRSAPLHDKVARVSGELDPRSRTMVVEVDLDNKNGELVAGSFVTVELFLTSTPLVQVPAEALVLKAQNPFVVVVTSTNRAELRPVVVANQDGTKAEIASGLQAGELVALNVGRNVAQGDLITPVVMPTAAPSAPEKAPKSDAPKRKEPDHVPAPR